MTFLFWLIGNVTGWWSMARERRYIWHPRWVVSLHWWARWSWMERTQEEWVG